MCRMDESPIELDTVDVPYEGVISARRDGYYANRGEDWPSDPWLVMRDGLQAAAG
jgi:hypothetical protein